MDDLDAAILREMFRGRTLIWGGGDPRLGTPELAERLGVDRTTVWARMKAWKESGFLVRQEVVPNPALFGVGIAGGDLTVKDPRKKDEAVAALRLVDGILGGMDLVGPYIIVMYAQESQAGLERCRALVGQLPHVEEVSICVPMRPPEPTMEPSPRDWRILKALRRSPDLPLTEVAKEAGISNRTLTRRYAELLEASAIWTFPLFDYTKYEGAVFARSVVHLGGIADVPKLRNLCQKDARVVWCDPLPDAVPGVPDEMAYVDVYLHLGSAAQVEEAERWLLDQPFVQEVESYFPRSWWAVPEWFDERIDRALKAAEAQGAR